MKGILSIYLFLIISIQVFPQADSILHIPDSSLSYYNLPDNTDSLKNILAQVNGKEKVNILCKISNSLLRKQANESHYCANWALVLADSIEYNNGRVMALYLLASKYMPGNYDVRKSRKLLQKAEGLLDGSVHWTLKYRLWFKIGQGYTLTNQLDSAMYYYNKPLTELDEEKCWFAHLGSYSWCAKFAKLNHEYEKEQEYLEKYFDLILTHYEYHQLVDERTILEALGRLSAFYTRHGDFKMAVANNKKLLDSIYVWNISSATKKVYIAKYLGKIGRAYHHWGKFDSAICYHDSSIYFFNKVYDENFADLSNETYPSMSEWAINYANQLEEKAGVQIAMGAFKDLETDLLQSVQMRRENNDPLGVAMSFDKLGEMFTAKWKFLKAKQYYDSALLMKFGFLNEFNSNIGSLRTASVNDMINESISYTYLKTGQMYKAYGKQNLAIGYIIKSLKLSRKIEDQLGEAESLTNLGDIYLRMNNSDSALACYLDARGIYQSIGNKPGLAMVYENMGNYSLSKENLREAMNKYLNAEILYEDLEMPADRARVLFKLADIFRGENKVSDAITKYEEGLQIAGKLDLKKLLVEGHKGLSEIYDQLNETGKAYYHYKAYTETSNEIFNLETNKQIAKVETQLKVKNKEQQFLLLQKESELQNAKATRSINILIVLISVSFITGFLLIIYLRQNKLKAEQEKTILQQKLFRLQMNPHFIFNSLASIQNSIINEEPMKASKYLARFSKLVRNILDSSIEDFIPLHQEISTIENYLALQKIRFPEKFEYSIDVDENLDLENMQIPPMLTQPFIENAIEHGIKHKNSCGNIWVRYKLNNGKIELEVEDNGIGRKRAQEILRTQNKGHKSLATSITLKRIKSFNKNLRKKITLVVQDLLDEKNEPSGTFVSIKVPLL